MQPLRLPDSDELAEIEKNLDREEAFAESDELMLDREWEKADLPPVHQAAFLCMRRQELAAREALYPSAKRDVRAQAIAPPRRLS